MSKKVLRLLHLSKPTNQGFTLIEVLVTLLIISLIAVLIHSSFGVCLQAWQKGEGKIELYQQVRSGLGLLSERISNSFMSLFNAGLSFEGGISHLNFTSLSQEGLQNVSLKVVNQSLIMEESPLVTAKDLEETVLIDQINYFELEYYDADSQMWVSCWDSKKTHRLPQAVKISLTIYTSRSKGLFSQNLRLVLPPLVIPIKAGYLAQPYKP